MHLKREWRERGERGGRGRREGGEREEENSDFCKLIHTIWSINPNFYNMNTLGKKTYIVWLEQLGCRLICVSLCRGYD
jgi:hypothetical protein